jgi:predicted translin family RNA/ssDNA-binding protein|tara:strand:+ start:652 stop:1044 length:393 start_codon:yes stop_codon:yes gene_type:complete
VCVTIVLIGYTHKIDKSCFHFSDSIIVMITVGGLCDLTGEVGRFAVKRGTARDFDGVGLCLETNSVILKSILLLEQTPSSINKKMDQLRKSVHKIERMMYEMSLSQAAGMNVSTEIKDNDAAAAAVEEDK